MTYNPKASDKIIAKHLVQRLMRGESDVLIGFTTNAGIYASKTTPNKQTYFRDTAFIVDFISLEDGSRGVNEYNASGEIMSYHPQSSEEKPDCLCG